MIILPPINEKAIVLFSGGLDSTTTLAIAKNAGYDLLAISFNYGQQQEIELKRAKTIAGHMAIEKHRVVNKAEIIKNGIDTDNKNENDYLLGSYYDRDKSGEDTSSRFRVGDIIQHHKKLTRPGIKIIGKIKAKQNQ